MFDKDEEAAPSSLDLLQGCVFRVKAPRDPPGVSLYTILQRTLLYDVWRETGGRKGAKYCILVLQRYCNRVGYAGGRGNKQMVDSCTKA